MSIRVTLEGANMEAVFDQMAITLGTKIRSAGGKDGDVEALRSGLAQAHAEIERLRCMVEDKNRELDSAADTVKRLEDKVRLRDLRITELEAHLAHAVGTRDLALKEAGASVPTDAAKAPEPRWEDVDRARKVLSDFDGRLPIGVWRLTIPQYQRFLKAPWQGTFKSTEMPNGEWIINTEKTDG